MSADARWTRWYIPVSAASGDSLLAAFGAPCEAAGAVRYDPFGLIPGKAWPRAVKLFIAPERAGWHALIAARDCALEPVEAVLSGIARALVARISADDQPMLSVLANGQHADLLATFRDLLSVPESVLLERLAASSKHARLPGGVLAESLPESAKARAGSLNTKQAEKMIKRLSNVVPKDQRSAAQDLINQSIDFDHGAGAWLRTALSAFGLPATAHLPDYSTLSTAYGLHRRKQRNPQARLYPGDAEALDAVPNALDYLPVFAGFPS